MVPWSDATNPGNDATVPRNDATVPRNQTFIPWGTPLHPGSGVKIITQVATNPGSHRPNLRSGPKNLRIYRSTPGSKPQPQGRSPNPRKKMPGIQCIVAHSNRWLSMLIEPFLTAGRWRGLTPFAPCDGPRLLSGGISHGRWVQATG